MFNSIVSMETVEHIENLDDYFSEVVRLLHPNGNLILYPIKNFIQNHISMKCVREFKSKETYFKKILPNFPIANHIKAERILD